MHKDKQNRINTIPSTTLDTLEVTSEIFKGKSHETLYITALRKYQTNQKVKALFDVSKDKIYWKAYHCNSILLQEGKTLKGSLCRKRWCNHCNRIRTAELIKGYQSPLEELSKENQIYFITLTAPTVKARQLKAEIDKRYKAWNRVKDRLRKQGIRLNGIRKLEITYSIKNDWFHPHFHFVCQGKRESELLLSYWLDEFKTADIKAQDIRQVGTTAKDLMEVFKYATKDIVKDETTAKATHLIYTALKGKRVFQTFGKIRKVKEPVKETIESIKHDWLKPTFDIYYFNQDLKDYENVYGEMLIGTKEIKEQLNKRDETSGKRKERFSSAPKG